MYYEVELWPMLIVVHFVSMFHLLFIESPYCLN